MDYNLYANIIEIMFLYFRISANEEKRTLSLEEVKQIFKSRYNWTWDNELEIGFQILLERSLDEQSGLISLSNSDKYEWRNSDVGERMDYYYKSVAFTSLSLMNNLLFIKRMKNLNINTIKVYEDSIEIIEYLVKEGDVIYLKKDTSELPF